MESLCYSFIAIIASFCLLPTNANSQQSEWQWQHPLPQGNSLNDVCFVDSLHGWAVGDFNTILHTSDGGISWQIQHRDIEQSHAYPYLSSVCFIDTSIGWAAGFRGCILHTTDGGKHWYYQNSGTANTLFDVFFTDKDNGWIVGAGGNILKYTAHPTKVEENLHQSAQVRKFKLLQNYPNPFNFIMPPLTLARVPNLRKGTAF